MHLMITFGTNSKLYTYIVAFDGGNAPNPYHGICTLGICKPNIRKTAQPGDVIVGIDSAVHDCGRIVYCLVVDESLSWEDYIDACKSGRMPRGKIPKGVNEHGDCIWHHAMGRHDPLKSHSGHGDDNYDTDVVAGINVVAGHQFWYFGRGDKSRIVLPPQLAAIISGRGHRSNSNHDHRDDFAQFFNNELVHHQVTTPGVWGTPRWLPNNPDKGKCSSCRAEQKANDLEGEEG